MKKCPKCDNPSYDGAQKCGNCGYKFPRPKQETIEKKSVNTNNNDDEDVITILKENKIVISAIIIITIIVISMMVLTGGGNNEGITGTGEETFSQGDISFTHPSSWVLTNLTDESQENSIIFRNSENSTIGYYNASTNSPGLQNLTDQRISNALYYGNSILTINIIDVNGNNGSDIVTVSPSGVYTRYVSILDDDMFHVFKIEGNSLGAVDNTEIENVINSIKL